MRTIFTVHALHIKIFPERELKATWFVLQVSGEGGAAPLTVHVGVQDVHKRGVRRVQTLLRRGAGEHRAGRVQTCRDQDGGSTGPLKSLDHRADHLQQVIGHMFHLSPLNFPLLLFTLITIVI